jgi:anti-sigma regulatory factor (Ser/Thr protein kinase)
VSRRNAGAVELALPRGPTAPAQARRQVSAVCQDLHRDVTNIATLLTSELVTNALVHGCGAIEMTIDLTPGQLRVDVQDESSQQPKMQASNVDSTRGRGLLLLERLASSWGVRKSNGGKGVWFTLRLRR